MYEMKKVTIFISFAAISLAFSNCSDPRTAHKKLLEREVLHYHDSIMANQGKLVKAEKELKILRENLLPTDTTLRQKINQNILHLTKAEDAMMDWMHNYRQDVETMPADSAITYLKQEMKNIQQVGNLMKSSLDEFNTLYSPKSNHQWKILFLRSRYF